MTQRDLLSEATRAFRQTSEDTFEPATETRDRVVGTLVRRQKVRRAAVITSTVIVVLLFASTTVAAITGRLPDVIDRVTSWITFGAAPGDGRPNEEPVLALTTNRPSPLADPLPEAEPLTEPEPEPLDQPPERLPEPLVPLLGQRPEPHRNLSRPHDAAVAPVNDEASQPPEPTREEEETAEVELPTNPHELYTRAHQLHFDERNYRTALVAWNRYIQAAPRGQFIMEARYNRAIALAQLGQRQAAIEALRPFAEGHYRGYQQHNAAQWIQALERVEPVDQP
jgi:hypothetical protein